MTTGVRFPIHLPFRHTIRRVYTRGIKYDLWNWQSLDMVHASDDFLGTYGSLSTLWTTGGAGTAAAVDANQLSGAVQLVTGAVNNQASVLYMGNKNWQADQNVTMAVRLNLTAITAVKCEIGLSDTNDANALGASGTGVINSLAATPTLTTLSAGSIDTCVAAIMDTSSGLTNPGNWRFVGAKGGTTWLQTPDSTSPAAIVAPVAATYQWIVIQLRRITTASEDVAAYLWINGVNVAKQTSAAATYNKQLYPYVMVQARGGGGASRTAVVDRIDVYQDRDVTA